MAIKGDKEAKHNLGWANKMGRGCKVNYKKAMTYLWKLKELIHIII